MLFRMEGGMRVFHRAAAAFLVFSVLYCLAGANEGQKKSIVLKPDLTIGVEDGSDEYIFESVSRIDLDKDGRIYALDHKARKVRVFDSNGRLLKAFSIPTGQGPAELSNIGSMAVSPEGLVFLNDMKIQGGRLAVSGLPWAVDRQGRFCFAEEQGIPRIVRYVME